MFGDLYQAIFKARQNVRRLIGSALLLSYTLSPAFAETPEPRFGTPDLAVVFAAHLSDVASRSSAGTVANTIAAVRALRQDYPDLIMIHAGAALGPSVMSNYDKGVHSIALVNLLKPDAYNVSSGDFAYGDDQISIRTREAAFPILSVNSLDGETGQPMAGVLPSVVVSRGGFQVGIVGSTSALVSEAYDTVFTQVVDPVEPLRAETQRLADQGLDLIIAVSDDIDPGIPGLRAAGVQADVMFQFEPLNYAPAQNPGPLDFYTDLRRGQFLLVFLKRTEDGWIADQHIINQMDYPADPEAVYRIQDLTTRLDAILNIPVVTTDVEVDTREAFVRTQESGFGNLVADVLRDETGADVAFINSGQIRGAALYPAGMVITRKDLQTELPFPDSITVIEVSGSEVFAALEHAVAMTEQLRGQFLQVSGLSFTYDPSQPVGERIVDVTFNGSPLSEADALRVALPKFLADGGDGFDMFASANVVFQDRASVLWERVFNNLRGRRDISFKTEGRIRLAGQSADG